MEKYLEKSREIPVRGTYDVIVAGGGTAGFAAAISAARRGSSVLVVERMNCLGGQMTAGIMGIPMELAIARVSLCLLLRVESGTSRVLLILYMV